MLCEPMSPPLAFHPEPPLPVSREESDNLNLLSSQNQRLRYVPGPRSGGDGSTVYGPLFCWTAAGYGIGPLALDALLGVVEGETKADICREGEVRDAVAC